MEPSPPAPTNISEKKVSKEKEAEFLEVFGLFDLEGKGAVATSELGTLVRALGQNPTESTVAQMKKEVDAMDTGEFQFQPFLQCLEKHYESPLTEEDIFQALKVFDKSGTGYIAADELRHALTTTQEALNEEEVAAFFANSKTAPDGAINCRELAKKLAYKA
ncbi:Calmodulin [Porphyridium purpureum]|uniref:Calmodulin n=1 Tax=Porphyridium purpureum TaxID=35688 RepID=A0A5J4Z7S7_PORPP|nr:Calmodulin [Porphyridium purpureum]|eukprot:POR6366..scf295_1